MVKAPYSYEAVLTIKNDFCMNNHDQTIINYHIKPSNHHSEEDPVGFQPSNMTNMILNHGVIHGDHHAMDTMVPGPWPGSPGAQDMTPLSGVVQHTVQLSQLTLPSQGFFGTPWAAEAGPRTSEVSWLNGLDVIMINTYLLTFIMISIDI